MQRRKQIKDLEGTKAAPSIVGWKLDRIKYRAIPFCADGKPGTPINPRPLSEQYRDEAIVDV